MSHLTGTFARVVFEGEIYFVLDSWVEPFDLDYLVEGVLYLTILLITKVEGVTNPGRKDKAIEVFASRCVPMASEINMWLGFRSERFY